jgi:uncharacterized phage protein gp47/JayE
MILQLQTFTSLVQGASATVQASASALLNFSTGSVLRAIMEASASIGLWMQWLILLVLQNTRAATSVGSDLDTWVADFSLTRLPAVAATGAVTFARYSTTATALIVPGVTVKTSDGTQTFTVTTDITNGLWNASQGGYLVPIGTTNATVPVAAVNLGAQGNIAAGTISLIASAISGIDTVTNASGYTNGINAESDAALRARFANYINTRAQGTDAAVGYAVSSVQQNLVWAIAENQNANGTTNAGNFVVTVDDGSGSPSSTLLAAVTAAVNLVRPVGTTYLVQGPAVTTANIAFTITVATGVVKANLLAPAVTAVTAYVNALPIGGTLPYSVIAKLVYDSATAGQITNVTGVTINSAAVDIAVAASGVVKAGTVVAS